MAERANIRDIQAITELQSALGRFAGNTQEALTTIEAEIARTQTWIQQQAQRGRHQILQARQTLQQAQAALNRCRSQVVIGPGGTRRPPDCRAEKRAVTEAQRRLRETEAQLQKVQQWQTRLASAVERYRRLARKLHELTTTQTKRTQARLDRLAARLEQYVVRTADGSIEVLSGDQKILRKMEKGVVDLSRPTEWGKFAHDAYEERLEQGLPGRVESEACVHVEKETDEIGKGRIDSFVNGTIIVDYKTHNLDRFKSESALGRELGKIALQLECYRDSPDTPTNAVPVVVFEFPPSNPDRRQFIESFFGGRGIHVIWDE